VDKLEIEDLGGWLVTDGDSLNRFNACEISDFETSRGGNVDAKSWDENVSDVLSNVIVDSGALF
jgi:hypothetical protein